MIGFCSLPRDTAEFALDFFRSQRGFILEIHAIQDDFDIEEYRHLCNLIDFFEKFLSDV